MPARPKCVVRVAEVPEEARPRRLPAAGVRSRVRPVGNSTGLSQMGVWVRACDPGFAGTHRHFHEVEEEWAFVLSGEGEVRIGAQRFAVRPGHLVGFPAGPAPHHFVAAGETPLVVLEGGERRPQEDACWYPDLALVYRGGRLEEMPAPADKAGTAGRCVHVDDVASVRRQHPVARSSYREMRALDGPAGLTRQSVTWARVEAGTRTTEFHTHDRTDEWVYILEGEAEVRVGEERFEVTAGDFLGHPAGGPAHVMRSKTPLRYLMGGQRDPEDVVTYPEAGKQLRAGRLLDLEPLEPQTRPAPNS